MNRLHKVDLCSFCNNIQLNRKASCGGVVCWPLTKTIEILIASTSKLIDTTRCPGAGFADGPASAHEQQQSSGVCIQACMDTHYLVLVQTASLLPVSSVCATCLPLLNRYATGNIVILMILVHTCQ